jgi:hypothetical protein
MIEGKSTESTWAIFNVLTACIFDKNKFDLHRLKPPPLFAAVKENAALERHNSERNRMRRKFIVKRRIGAEAQSSDNKVGKSIHQTHNTRSCK